MKNRVVLIVAVADRVHTTKSRFKEIIFAFNVQYKPLWWFLNAVKFNLCSDSFEITSPVAILGIMMCLGGWWSVLSNLKVSNLLLL